MSDHVIDPLPDERAEHFLKRTMRLRGMSQRALAEAAEALCAHGAAVTQPLIAGMARGSFPRTINGRRTARDDERYAAIERALGMAQGTFVGLAEAAQVRTHEASDAPEPRADDLTVRAVLDAVSSRRDDRAWRHSALLAGARASVHMGNVPIHGHRSCRVAAGILSGEASHARALLAEADRLLAVRPSDALVVRALATLLALEQMRDERWIVAVHDWLDAPTVPLPARVEQSLDDFRRQPRRTREQCLGDARVVTTLGVRLANLFGREHTAIDDEPSDAFRELPKQPDA